MNELTFSSEIEASPDALFAWHARPGAFQRLVPPWAPVRLERFDGIQEGDRAVLRIGPGPLALRWVAEHHDVIDGRQFCDRQVQGPFAHWDHTHRFELVDEGDSERSRLVDRIEYELPGGPLGALIEPWVEPELRRQFAYRHRITARDLARHRRYDGDGRSLRIAVSGSSGLIGSQLVPSLTTGGHSVQRLIRSGPTGPDEVLWNVSRESIEAEKLEGVDAVIHLAGEPVWGLWTDAKKRRIRNSRVRGTRFLAETLAGLEDPPAVFISASGVGYYGDHGDEWATEESPPRDTGFMSSVCQDWEQATEPAESAGIRTVQARIGVVLSPAGGALRMQWPLFWLGLGGAVGAPDRFLSWISLDDVLGALYHILWTENVRGPVNLTAPTPVTMEAYAHTLGRVLRRPASLRVPTSWLQGIPGEMSDELLQKSVRARPAVLRKSGYRFADDGLDGALRHVLGRD